MYLLQPQISLISEIGSTEPEETLVLEPMLLLIVFRLLVQDHSMVFAYLLVPLHDMFSRVMQVVMLLGDLLQQLVLLVLLVVLVLRIIFLNLDLLEQGYLLLWSMRLEVESVFERILLELDLRLIPEYQILLDSDLLILIQHLLSLPQV